MNGRLQRQNLQKVLASKNYEAKRHCMCEASEAEDRMLSLASERHKSAQLVRSHIHWVSVGVLVRVGQGLDIESGLS